MDESEGLSCVRVAVNLKNQVVLMKLDLSQPIENVIEQLCTEEGTAYVHGRLGLWTDKPLQDDTKCVQDGNKHLLKPGSFLVLKDSPTTLVASLMENADKADELTVGTFLQRVEAESADVVVLNTLAHFNAHETVFQMLEDNWIPSHSLTCGLIFINRMYTIKLIRRVPPKIISRIFDAIASGYIIPEQMSVEVFHAYIVQCLKLLSTVRRHGRLRYKREQLFDHLSALLLDRNRPEVQEAALELLNFLVLFPKDAEEERDATKRVVNQKIVGCIRDSVLVGEPTKGMQQQLYRYQTLLLRPYWHKKVTKVLNTDPIMNDLKKLTRKAKKGKNTQTRRRIFSEGDEREAVTLPVQKEKFSLLRNLRTSFRKRSASPSQKNPLSAPSSPVPEVPERVRSRSHHKLTRNGKRFYSCLVSNEPASDAGSDEDAWQFAFYGPIDYAAPVTRRESQPAVIIKAASTSNLADTSPVVFHYKQEEKALKDPTLSTKAVSELTVDNLRYLATHFEDLYRKWAVSKKQNYRFADQITHVVCRVLEVGRPRHIDSPGDGFHPLVLLGYPHVLQELFCDAFALHDRTGKEMKANETSDESKILATVQEQLVCALSTATKNGQPGAKPTSFDQLREKLSWINYDYIAEKRRRERNEVINYELRTKPLFLEFRKSKHQCTMDLIKQHRIHFLKKGQHMPKFNIRGELQKNTSSFLALNEKGDHLIVGECIKMPKTHSHSQRLAVSDIAEATFGKQSKFYGKVFSHNENRVIKTQTPGYELWPYFFCLKTFDDKYYNFCAPDATSLDYWTDAFNVLQGRPMSSQSMTDELQEILDLEVRLHFLDVEEIPIPDVAPPVPALPPNFNFASTEFLATKLTSTLITT